MAVRPFASGYWFGSIVVAGLLVTWIDYMIKVSAIGIKLANPRQKEMYGKTMAFMGIVGAILLILLVYNLIIPIQWLNIPIVLDEITLFTLLLCLCQETIIGIIISNLRK